MKSAVCPTCMFRIELRTRLMADEHYWKANCPEAQKLSHWAKCPHLQRAIGVAPTQEALSGNF